MFQDHMLGEKFCNISGQIQSEPVSGSGPMDRPHRSHKHRALGHYGQIPLQGARQIAIRMSR